MADNLFVVCEPRADVLQGALKQNPRRVLMALRFLLIDPNH